jgi:chemotaxis protein methyltransferase CheR
LSNFAESIDQRLYTQFRDLIRDRTGIVLRSNASDTERMKLQNRLSRPMKALGLPTFEQLWQTLKSSRPESTEWQLFIHAVSTHKTDFFREPAHFQHLTRHAVSIWRRNRGSVKVWSAACSTGEEPVSAAIALLSSAVSRAQIQTGKFQILATDLDPVVIETAKQAIYPKPDLPQPTLKEHFLEGTGTNASLVKVKDHVRNHIQYARFNLIHSAYPSQRPFDAIFCRNVLIYFDEPTRDAVVTKLAQSLAPGGLLFFGHAESFSYRHDLECVAPTVYRNKKNSPGPTSATRATTRTNR